MAGDNGHEHIEPEHELRTHGLLGFHIHPLPAQATICCDLASDSFIANDGLLSPETHRCEDGGICSATIHATSHIYPAGDDSHWLADLRLVFEWADHGIIKDEVEGEAPRHHIAFDITWASAIDLAQSILTNVNGLHLLDGMDSGELEKMFGKPIDEIVETLIHSDD